MLYIRFENFEPVEIVETHSSLSFTNDVKWAFDIFGKNTGNGWMNKHDFSSAKMVQDLADKLTSKFDAVFLSVIDGTRFDVIKAPKIGDKVSKYFNGDAYPEGEIIRITNKWQVTTSTGVKFRRQQETGVWKEVNGTFFLMQGHHNERNPHF